MTSEQNRTQMSDIAKHPTPESIMGELVAITEEVKRHPVPVKPKDLVTSKESLESAGSLEMTVSGLLLILLSVAAACVTLMVAPAFTGLPLLGFVGGTLLFTVGEMIPHSGRLVTRVLRRKHYKQLEAREKADDAAVWESYEQAVKKHEQVTKRLRKRARPIIEHFNTVNPDKELVLTAAGFDVKEKYDEEQRKLINIGVLALAGGTSGNAKEIMSKEAAAA